MTNTESGLFLWHGPRSTSELMRTCSFCTARCAGCMQAMCVINPKAPRTMWGFLGQGLGFGG